MANWCKQCPNRWQARIAESMGDPDLAREIEAAGCNNWKTLEYKIEDRETGQPLGKEDRTMCMRDHLPAWFNSVDAKSAHAVKVAATHRNVVAEGFSHLVGQPVTGDLESLPVEFREALAEAGIGTTKALTSGGGAVGRSLKNQGRRGELPEAAGDGE